MSLTLNVKSTTGSTISLNVNQNDTISDIKSKLKQQEQKYIYGYLQFQPGDTLSDYNIHNEQSLMMTVILNDGTSTLVVLNVEPDDNLEILKNKAKIEANIKNIDDIVALNFAGIIPNDKTLLECNIKNKSTIHGYNDNKNNNNNKDIDNNNDRKAIKSKKSNIYNNYNTIKQRFKNGSKSTPQQLQMTDLSQKNNNGRKSSSHQPLLTKIDEEGDCCTCSIL